MIRSTLVNQDVVVGEEVRLVVPADKTLTVEQGATLSVYGELVVQGKLENRGTIVVGELRAYKETDDLYIKSRLINEEGGVILNTGSINVVRGEIDNNAKAMFTNDGRIDITNRHEELTGLSNRTITTTVTVGATFVNNGVIFVNNEVGYGIRSATESTFENNGEIQVSETGKVAGVITGNRVTAAPVIDTPVYYEATDDPAIAAYREGEYPVDYVEDTRAWVG
jgi:hypothetical protein